jgi:hypothetical protein
MTFSILNEMKMADKNMSFIIYFQFNRSVEDLWKLRIKANPKNFLHPTQVTFIHR